MIKKYISINGFEIAWLEAHPHNSFIIFFIHGNSGSSRTWLKQFADPAFAGYRLIALDLPAHGDTPASPEPGEDYSLPAMGKLIADAILALAGNQPYILTGFSLGSNVLAEALPWLTNIRGIVLAGSSVVGGEFTMDKVFHADLDGTVFFADNATVESVNAFAKNISESIIHEDIAAFVSDHTAVKPGFRPGFFKTVMEGKINDEIALIRDSKIPALVIFGLSEKMVKPDYLDEVPFKLWGDKVYKIPGAGHAVHIDQPAIFNDLLLSYANERFGG